MKYLLYTIVLAALLAAGCKQGSPAVADPAAADVPEVSEVSGVQETTPPPATVRREDIPFDELFSIFSQFGNNIMTDKFAAQSVKDGIKEDLRSSYDGYREFNKNACNNLSYSIFGGDCYDGFQLGCWRYDADGHLLVLIAENGGCDCTATKYIRAYDYDPSSGQMHEVDMPLNPAPKADDFNDIIRLAGCNDVAYARKIMRDRVYNYRFSPEGLLVELNLVDDWEANGNCGFQLFYRWNGSEFVRDESVPVPCIHFDGFAMIKLGEPIPNLRLSPDPLGYQIEYSEGGDLWLVERGPQDVLQIQMDGGKVYSIEVFDPRYSLTENFYWDGKGLLAPGSLYGDFFSSFSEPGAPQVWLYSDGTVQVTVEQYNTLISLNTTSEALQGPVPEVGFNEVKVLLDNPKFIPEASVQSITISRVQ